MTTVAIWNVNINTLAVVQVAVERTEAGGTLTGITVNLQKGYIFEYNGDYVVALLQVLVVIYWAAEFVYKELREVNFGYIYVLFRKIDENRCGSAVELIYQKSGIITKCC